jgi:protease I
MEKLKEKKVAVLIADGFEQIELTSPVKALRDEGAEMLLVSPSGSHVQGFNHQEKGEKFKVDLTLDKAEPSSYHALLLPGGLRNPDTLRQNSKAVGFVRHFIESGKPVAAICHGPWLLVEADAVRGKRITSYPSIKTDLKNAGAEWTDQAVVVDEGIVTSRSPEDLPAFNQKFIEEILKGELKKGVAALANI